MEENVIQLKPTPSKTDVKVFNLNNDLAYLLSKYTEEEQFVAVAGILLSMFGKNPTLKEALLKLLESRG